MDEEEAADSVHGKLMQGCDVTDDVSPNHAANSATARKSPSALDFKVDISVSKASGSAADRRRQALRARRRWIVGVVVCLVVVVIILVPIIVLLVTRKCDDDPRCPASYEPILVKTSIGTIRGRIVDAPQGGSSVAEYLGIPFAKPPLGDLRYADPEPLYTLPSDPYEADDVRNACMQPIDDTYGDFVGTDMWNAKNTISEDCLYLNVWTPVVSKVDGDQSVSPPALKAVMVWIYGGGFYSGSNSLWVYDGKALAVFGDVVVVSFNYRVGTFGFLSTGDGRIRGNFGMKDQVVVLRWIRDHIAAFGGDRDRVTLYGESSGASSAGLHQMSADSRDLFARAIYQSGSPDSQWSFMTRSQARQRSIKFLDAVGCGRGAASQTGHQLLTCLRRLDARFILNSEWVLTDFMVFPWVPTVDGDFLIDTPYNMLKAGRFQKKDALLGVNRDEGTFWILFALPGLSKDGPSPQNLTMFNSGMDTIAWDLNANQRRRLRQRYLVGDGHDTDANRDSLDKVCGDRSFTCPTKELTNMFSRRGIRTFFYFLTFRASTEVWPDWMGVIHGADIQWAFGMPLNRSRGYTQQEVEFAKIFMTYWTNFAKTGDPNGDGVPPWPEYTSSQPRYLELKGAEPSSFAVLDSFRDDICRLWREINRQLQEAAAANDAQLGPLS